MATSFDQASAALQATGMVSLPGRRSLVSKVVSVEIWVLVTMTAVLAVGSVVMIIVAYANGIFVNPIGFLAPVMAGGMCLAVWRVRLRHKRYADAEKLPVVFAAHGFSVAGIGLIPWQDVAPIQQHETSTALMLSPSGLHNVNALSTTQRRLLRTVGGNPLNGWKGRSIAAPSVQGMSSAESMSLFATAHRMFWRPVPAHGLRHA